MSTGVLPPPESTRVAGASRVVARVRGAWQRQTLARAIAWAPVLGIALAVVLVLIDLLSPLPAAVRIVARWLPLVVTAGVVFRGGWRVVRPPGTERLALLAEERLPQLQNRLSTAIATDAGAGIGDGVVARAFRADAEARLAAADLGRVAPLRLGRPLALLAIATVGVVAFGTLVPAVARDVWTRWQHPRDAYESRWREVRAEVLPTVPTPPMPGFDELRWRIAPPAYTGLRPTEGRGEGTIAALPGSRVRLRSRFPDRWERVRAARIGGGPLEVRRAGGEWAVEWTQSTERGITLDAIADGRVVARRVLPVTTLSDRPPVVLLAEPEADLILASGTGRVAVHAAASDDFGLASLRIGWIRSRGSGESFEFVEGSWELTRMRRDGRRWSGALELDLGAMGLKPGDMIHLRAIARDRNDVTGPGESVSGTRVIRVVREGEMDQVNAVLGLPPEMPKDPVLSQRMLILMTERLVRRAPQLAREATAREAAEIAHEQARLRERVGDQVFTRSTGGVQSADAQIGFQESSGFGHGHAEEHAGAAAGSTEEETLAEASEATGQGTIDEVRHAHDEDPIIDMNATLLKIFNLMWASERELNQAAPAASLPHQREALRLIQLAQQGERVYARGRVRVDPVDVARARGEGKVDEAAPERRSTGSAVPSAAPLLAELDRAVHLLRQRGPRDAAFPLAALAARALGDPAVDPGAAGLISRAASEAAGGRGEAAGALLARARAALAAGKGGSATPLPHGTDPAAAEYFRRLGRGGRR